MSYIGARVELEEVNNIMLVKHSCGHQVNVPSRFAPFVRRTFCPECQRIREKIMEEQRQKFQPAPKSV